MVSDLKYLGLFITSNLSWDKQIIEQARGINWKLVQLKRLSKIGCSSNLLLQMYWTFIQPKIDYGISLWGCTNKKNLNKIQRLQNRAARIILNNHDFRGLEGLT